MNRAAKIQLLKDLREGRKSLADFTMQKVYISGFPEDSDEHKEFIDLCRRSDAVFMPVFPLGTGEVNMQYVLVEPPKQ